MLKLFPSTAKVNKGRLTIGGCDTVALVKEFGTPLYIFDEAALRGRCSEYRKAFQKRYPDSTISYACKAYINKALAQLFNEEGLSLDAVSAGEIAIAKEMGFPMRRVYFNGNNKSRAELEEAVAWGVKYIIVDNFHELSMLNEVAKAAKVRQDILLRLSPGIDPHTHAYLTTGNVDSKFGFLMRQAGDAVSKAMSSKWLNLVGLHFHIGSQLFDLKPYLKSIKVVVDFAAAMKRDNGFEMRMLVTGGGLGIAYLSEHEPPSVDDFAETITSNVIKRCKAAKLELPHLVVEPGRSIVGQAGVALYTVGAIKEIEGVRKYVLVDGGMSDNIRPSLYGAKYEAIIANKAGESGKAKTETVTIGGKYCESGDILISDIDMPKIETGDIIAVPCCGAYCLSMASNYNASLKPPIVLARDGKAKLIRRRETYKDLTKCDMV
ncbi:MAG: diaminopimelate decarboxylase [Dehalococcoidia bacterium]|jgi:diaminopimelate decarboxylase